MIGASAELQRTVRVISDVSRAPFTSAVSPKADIRLQRNICR